MLETTMHRWGCLGSLREHALSVQAKSPRVQRRVMKTLAIAGCEQALQSLDMTSKGGLQRVEASWSTTYDSTAQ